MMIPDDNLIVQGDGSATHSKLAQFPIIPLHEVTFNKLNRHIFEWLYVLEALAPVTQPF